MDQRTLTSIDTTADALRAAAAACRRLLASAHPGTQEAALEAGRIAVEATVADENWLDTLEDPVTHRSRCGYAGWLMLLAGIESNGTTVDVRCAAALFENAARC
jgi:hypothetical protein